MKIYSVAILAGSFAVASFAASPSSPPKLIDISGCPASEMKPGFSVEQWEMLKKAPCVAYVHLNGVVENSGHVDRFRVEEAYPDQTWAKKAESFTEKVVLDSSAIGSHIKPRADVWVIFYGPAKNDSLQDGKLVLIFGKSASFSMPAGPGSYEQKKYLQAEAYN